ncbi:hypothetical protein PQX77_002272 [Marasmius sp. AFHP31]|nr:hypothetical protein PQX77_002272 [Marasmius sp. AFHP31]
MGSLAGPTTLTGLLNAPTSEASYPRNFVRDNIADTMAKNERTGRKNHDHNGGRPRMSNYDNTQNTGDRNKTYQRSHVSEQYRYDNHSNNSTQVHLYLHERESFSPAGRESTSLSLESLLKQQGANSLPGRQAASPFISHYDTPPQGLSLTPISSFKKPLPLSAEELVSLSTSHASSQDTLLGPKSSPPSHQTKGKERAQVQTQTQTRSELYQTLLLGCKLGFPLWDPSPRRTLDGEHYMPEIGDVGVLCHALPFNTLFNIAQPLDSPANKNGVPEGLGPPCELQLRWITIKERNNLSQVPLSQPEGAISDQKRGVTMDGSSSIFTYDLSEKEGALLMLPHGSTLWNLENTAPFEERARLQWRQWFKYAYGHLSPEDGRALYLVTGVERCRTWAMAAWSSISSYTRDRLDSLELTVDSTTGACSWAFPPVRCSTEVAIPPTTKNLQSARETVFIRGFRIDVLDGNVSLRPPGLSSQPEREMDDSSDRKPDSKASGSRDPAPSSNSSSNPSSSSHFSCSGGGNSGASYSQFDAGRDPQTNAARILELVSGCFSHNDNDFSHPCQVINKLSFWVASQIMPALMDTGFMAFSHDNNWISIMQDSDQRIPPDAEIVRQICSKYKFALKRVDVISPVPMSNSEKNLIKKQLLALSLQQSPDSVTLVLFDLLEDNRTADKHTDDNGNIGPRLSNNGEDGDGVCGTTSLVHPQHSTWWPPRQITFNIVERPTTPSAVDYTIDRNYTYQRELL